MAGLMNVAAHSGFRFSCFRVKGVVCWVWGFIVPCFRGLFTGIYLLGARFSEESGLRGEFFGLLPLNGAFFTFGSFDPPPLQCFLGVSGSSGVWLLLWLGLCSRSSLQVLYGGVRGNPDRRESQFLPEVLALGVALYVAEVCLLGVPGHEEVCESSDHADSCSPPPRWRG